MWARLLLLLLYLCLLFLLARLLEAAAWCSSAEFALRLADPMELSLRRLRVLLESRGLSFGATLGRADAGRLLESSGEVTEGELYSALKERQDEGDVQRSTDFTGELHFFEQVEDSKDSVWLVQITCGFHHHSLLTRAEWKEVVQKVSRFGIRTGTFHCSMDPRFCIKRRWLGPRLILAVPQTNTSKGKVDLYEFEGMPLEARNVLEWVHSIASKRISTARSPTSLNARLKERNSQSWPLISVLLLAPLQHPPLFFAALAARFSGRMDFLFVDMRGWSTKDVEHCSDKLGVTRFPAYLVQTPEGTYMYGTRRGEHHNLRCLDLFLRFLQPEVNDLFLLSLGLLNGIAWLDIFLTCGAAVKRFAMLIRSLGSSNILFLLSWLPLLGFLQLPLLQPCHELALKLIRYASISEAAAWLRADWLFYSSHHGLLLITYLNLGLLMSIITRLIRARSGTPQNSTASENNLEWLSSLWVSYSNFLFQPHIQPFAPSRLLNEDLDIRLAMFQRIAIPDLLLRVSIPTTYIKELFSWEHRLCLHHRQNSSGNDYLDCDTRVPQETLSHSPSSLAPAESFHDSPHQNTMPSDPSHSACTAEPERGPPHKNGKDVAPENVTLVRTCTCGMKKADCKKRRSTNEISDGLKTRRGGRVASTSPEDPGSTEACKQSNQRQLCRCPLPGNPNCRTVPARTCGANTSWSTSPSCMSCQRDEVCRLSWRETSKACSTSWLACSDCAEMWPPAVMQSPTCVICLELFSCGCQITALPCGHAFHHQCILRWLYNSRHCCPICRHPAYQARSVGPAD
uniref:E3 ubiquitin-protein ligase RNF103 n=1 Tax=Myxine glutinosa TaxID=7769 RepID=UPI00358DE7A8